MPRSSPQTPKKEKRRPGVIFQPEVYYGMQRGIDQLVKAIRPTLGPLPRTVLIEKLGQRNARPEIFDDGGTIARRLIQLPDRQADMGAMYLRHSLWRIYERVGDGTATATVLFDAIFRQGVKTVIGGANAMRLRRYLESGCQVIQDELSKQTLHLQGKQPLAHLAESICYDPELALYLGEIFDIIGAYGQLEVRPGRGRELEREYVEGMYWDGAIFSRAMIEDIQLGRAKLENPSIFISDLDVSEPADLLPLLETCLQEGIKSLLLVVATLSEKAISILTMQPNRERIHVVAVKSPAIHADVRRESLEDIAILTGGRAFHKAAGDTLRSVKPADLGRARRAWADPHHFGISGGKGDPRQFRQHLAEIRAAYAQISDTHDRQRRLERIGRLMGGSAVLWVGANTPFAVDARKSLASRTADAMRGALRDGVLPGAGAAFLACQPALQSRLQAADSLEERAAYLILLKAVEQPLRTLVSNAGYDPSTVLAEVLSAGAPHGFDVLRGQTVNVIECGLLDSAAVIQEALFSAIHGAALALTVDVFVHRANPPESAETG